MSAVYIVYYEQFGARFAEAFDDLAAAEQYESSVQQLRPGVGKPWLVAMPVRSANWLALHLPMCASQDDTMAAHPECDRVATASPKRCEPCRATGAIHCAHPDECGGPWDTRAAA